MSRQDWETCTMVTQQISHALRGERFDASEDVTGRGTPLIPVAFRDPSPTLTARMQGSAGWAPHNEDAHLVGQPVTFRGTSDCLTAAYGTKWNGNASAHNGSLFVAQPMALGTDCYNGAITGDVAATLGTPGSSVNASGPTVMQPVGVTFHGTDGTASVASLTEISSSLRARIPSGVENSTTTAVMQAMQVRRLTPMECERLQGFPDGHTAIPWRNKPADQCPDGPRYKALGNSMAVPVMRWIGEGIDQWR